MSERATVGLVGVGRLGAALARRLPAWPRLLLADREAARAEMLAEELGATAASVPAVFAESEVVLLVVPPEETLPLTRAHACSLRPGALVVNMATSVPTAAVLEEVGRADVVVVGAKLVGQAHAVATGRSGIFVTASDDPEVVAALRRLFGPIGPVVVGDEDLVARVNREATRAALELAIGVRGRLEGIAVPAEWIDVALKTVAVGTLEDYPPRGPNYYVEAILAELRQARRLGGQTQTRKGE